jgi:DNA-binding NarL/FixJ family response regulator
MNAAASLLIVEDHPLYRDGLVQLLGNAAAFSGLKILIAESAEEGIRIARRTADMRLVIVDPGLRGLRGAQAVALFCGSLADVPVLALSASEDRRDAAAALRAGACGFVSKEVPTEVLIETLSQVLAGALPTGTWITRAGAGLVADQAVVPLTPRQREVLALLCKGHSNKEICLRLQLAEVTVKMHVSLVFRALGVATRTQAVAIAHRWGLDAADATGAQPL